jgi:hypothetical protein
MEAGDNANRVHDRRDDGDSGSQDGREGRDLRRREVRETETEPLTRGPHLSGRTKKGRSGPCFNIR